MGIAVEFNPELCLRSFSVFSFGRRKTEECLPERLEAGKTYFFLKEGLRCYWMRGQIALRETKGNAQLSRPLASVVLLEATHFCENGKLFIGGNYKVIEVLPRGGEIRFEGF